MTAPAPTFSASRGEFAKDDPGLEMVYVLGRLAIIEEVRQRHWQKLKAKLEKEEKRDGDGRDPDD